MKLNNFFYFFLASVLFISCEEEFLTEYPTSFITPDQIAAASAVNPDLQGGTVAGIYENIYKSGTGGTSNHDDFGQRGWVLQQTCFQVIWYSVQKYMDGILDIQN